MVIQTDMRVLYNVVLKNVFKDDNNCGLTLFSHVYVAPLRRTLKSTFILSFVQLY